MHAIENDLNSTTPGLASLLEIPGMVFSPDCPARQVLQTVTSRWAVLVLVALLAKTYRFSELRRKIGGVSEKMLAQTLQALEQEGFVIRKSFPVVPPHVEYSLTPMGNEIAQQVESMTNWINQNLYRIMQHKRAQQHSATESTTE